MVVDLKGAFGRVWVGLKPIPLKHLGPRKTGDGITAGPVSVPGGFAVKSLGRNVFKRKGAKRLPIEKQSYAIDKEAAPIIDAVASEVEERLYTEFENALAWHSSK
jgi:hypothetical protein